jgi:hypothetical protein
MDSLTLFKPELEEANPRPGKVKISILRHSSRSFSLKLSIQRMSGGNRQEHRIQLSRCS